MPIFHHKIWKYQVRDALIYWFVIPVSVLGSGAFIDSAFHLPVTGSVYAQAVAAVFLATGLVIIRRAMHDLRVYGRGTPSPRRPPRLLVRQGVYGMCRHPMFLGYDLAALGVVLLFGSPGMLFFSYPVFLYFQIRFLRREEQYLGRRFHPEFTEYKRLVPFLVPGKFFRKKK